MLNKRLFYIFTVIVILLQLLLLRYQSVVNYRNNLLNSTSFTLPLVKDPENRGYYKLLNFGYIKVKYTGEENYRVGDVLEVLTDKTSEVSKGIFILKVERVERVGQIWYTPVMRYFSTFKHTINNLYLRNLPAPYGELLAGMTLGIKNITPQFEENLIKTGVIHVVVVSGFNITLVITALFPLFLKFGRKLALFMSIIGVAMFVLLVGLEPPVVRAAIMGSIVLYGKYCGREKNILAILFMSAYVMLFANPLLINELSFILSFSATFGLVVLAPFVENMLSSMNFFGLKQDFVATISAQIMVWPIISYYFGKVSLISPIANLLVLWIVPIITVFGFIYALLTLILEMLGITLGTILLSFVIKLPLVYFSQLTDLFAKMPLSQAEFAVNKEFIFLYYLLLAVIVIWAIIKKKEIGHLR